MTLEDAQKIVDKAEEEGLDVTLYENYSGRGMFGATTSGVVGSTVDITEAATLAGLRARTFRWDNMALDMIAY